MNENQPLIHILQMKFIGNFYKFLYMWCLIPHKIKSLQIKYMNVVHRGRNLWINSTCGGQTVSYYFHLWTRVLGETKCITDTSIPKNPKNSAARIYSKC